MSITVVDPFGVAPDAAMPFLAAAMDPNEVEVQFARHLARWAGPESCTRLRAIRVTRYKAGRRCLIEYDVKLERPHALDQEITLIGKAKARRVDESTFRLLESLREAGFGEDSADGVLVPEPVGIIPDYQMWLQRKVPGTPATLLLAAADGIALAAHIARAVHKLHQTEVPCQRVHTISHELEILHNRLRLVGRMKPEWADRLERLLAACDRLGAGLAAPRLRGIHRDFYADHVLVDASRLYLLDFDLHCQGDPALDIGNFSGHMIEHSLRTRGVPDALAEPQRELEKQFLALSGDSTADAVSAYTTLALVRHIFLSTQFPERHHTTQALLELCEDHVAKV